MSAAAAAVVPSTADEALDRAAMAARSKINHAARVAAAEQQRNLAFVELHRMGWSYAKIATEVRAWLIAAGLSDDQIEACGIGHDNVRSAVRKTRPRK